MRVKDWVRGYEKGQGLCEWRARARVGGRVEDPHRHVVQRRAHAAQATARPLVAGKRWGVRKGETQGEVSVGRVWERVREIPWELSVGCERGRCPRGETPDLRLKDVGLGLRLVLHLPTEMAGEVSLMGCDAG